MNKQELWAKQIEAVKRIPGASVIAITRDGESYKLNITDLGVAPSEGDMLVFYDDNSYGLE